MNTYKVIKEFGVFSLGDIVCRSKCQRNKEGITFCLIDNGLAIPSFGWSRKESEINEYFQEIKGDKEIRWS